MSFQSVVLIGLVTLITIKLFSFILSLGKGHVVLKKIPGPKLWETISQFWLHKNKIQTILCTWAKDYGPMYRLSFIGTDVLVLNCPRLIKKAFLKNELSASLGFTAMDVSAQGEYGIISAEHSDYVELKKFFHHFQRSFTFLNEIPRTILMEELSHLTTSLETQIGKPVNLQEYIMTTTINSIWVLSTSQRFPIEKEGNWAIDFFHSLNDALAHPVTMFFPHLAKICPWLFKCWRKYAKVLQKVWFYIDKVVDEHVTSFDPEKDVDSMDFIHAFLKEIKNPTNSSSHVFNSQVGYKHLKATMIVFLAAGGDITTSQTNFLIQNLIIHSEWQDKIRREIKTHIGTSRVPTIEDRRKMVQTQAFIYETMRMCPIGPFIVHRASGDLHVERGESGIDIPKGTFVIANLMGAHHDPSLWDEPGVFRPERFLSPDQSELIRHEAFISFSAGQRKCIGQQNALELMFLYVTHLVQRFEIQFDLSTPVDLDIMYTFILSVKPYKVVLTEPIP